MTCIECDIILDRKAWLCDVCATMLAVVEASPWLRWAHYYDAALCARFNLNLPPGSCACFCDGSKRCSHKWLI